MPLFIKNDLTEATVVHLTTLKLKMIPRALLLTSEHFYSCHYA